VVRHHALLNFPKVHAPSYPERVRVKRLRSSSFMRLGSFVPILETRGEGVLCVDDCVRWILRSSPVGMNGFDLIIVFNIRVSEAIGLQTRS